MKLVKELERRLVNDMSLVKNVEVDYGDKEIVSGFIVNITALPLTITLCKHKVQDQNNLHHILDLDRARKVKIDYHSGEHLEFID